MPTNEYMKEYRQTPAGKAALERDKKRSRARNAAVNLLIKKHPTEWTKIYADMLKTYGVDD